MSSTTPAVASTNTDPRYYSYGQATTSSTWTRPSHSGFPPAYQGNKSIVVTYQFVIVAVIVCSLFAMGVLWVMYRRRRNLVVMEQMAGLTGTRMYVQDGMVVMEHPAPGPWGNGAPGGRTGPVVVGKVPEVWDSCVGPPEKGSERGRDEKSRLAWENATPADEVSAWNPLAIALPARETSTASPPSTPAPQGNPHVDVSVLIAMPSQHLPTPLPNAYPVLDMSGVPRNDDEDDLELPVVSLATTRIDVATAQGVHGEVGEDGSDEGWAPLDSLRAPVPVPPAPRAPHRGQRGNRGVERVRVDGFREFRGRWMNDPSARM